METSAVLSIRVQQVVTMAPELGIGFTALKHEVSIDEGISEGTVVKVLELDQVPNPGLRLDCENYTKTNLCKNQISFKKFKNVFKKMIFSLSLFAGSACEFPRKVKT